MKRIQAAFDRLKRERRKGIIPFLVAGDPDLETTRELLIELGKAGSTLIELGVPFSDPMADGPVIQRAAERALKKQFGLGELLSMVSEVREVIETPLVLFSYLNPLLQYGFQRLAQDARSAGIDGVLVTDLSPEEADEFANYLRANDLDMIFLAAPTSSDERLQMIASKASGFIYAVSRLGVTGAQADVSRDAEELVNRVRRFTELPIAVGFGISNADQVSQVWRSADAAVVGSAIVAEIERLRSSPDLVGRTTDFYRSLIPGIGS
jgi:tryptophan synthase alpha chain